MPGPPIGGRAFLLWKDVYTMSKKPKPCREEGCERPKFNRSPSCGWHWALRQPIEVQVHAAQWRLSQTPEDARRARVPASEWPEGERWCSGCQTMVPLFYTQGSRCKACASQASHAGHIERTYGLSEEDYRALLAWQGGVCFVCRKVPRGNRRLAVDHCHTTGRVRGLLCANDQWGCNRAVLGVVQDLATARRLVAYYEMTPIERMRQGQEPYSD